MADEKEVKAPAEPKPAAVAPVATVAKGEPQYVGPKPAPRIIIPGDRQPKRADTLTTAERAYVLSTVPEAKGWWK